MGNGLRDNKFIQRLEKCVLDGLKDEDMRIVLFGSRARGDSATSSDMDVGLIPKGKVDRKKITLLRESVEDLNIPYKVDIVDFSCVGEEFKKEALKEVEVWKD
ncbi:nucleotidyltransferase domain-containing protein [bacterium]|nr:nucleotidyltransferase domain-containing protein [bacterium]MBU1613695.1 nucleotidyltransferase domain-containing protein [bacterium]